MKGSLLINGLTIAASFAAVAVFMLQYMKTAVEVQEMVEEHKSTITDLKNLRSSKEARIALLMKKTELLEKEIIAYKEVMDLSMTTDRVQWKEEDVPGLSCISKFSTSEDIIFDGCNVHITNGVANKIINGFGNLIVGYDTGDVTAKVGSHNVVVRPNHEYTSYCGLVAGKGNKISAPFATVTGGANNTASGWFSTVAGGELNEASESWSSVSGGYMNTASAEISSVSGGWNNTAQEMLSSISGGSGNIASGRFSHVAGGKEDTSEGVFSSNLGGYHTTSKGAFSTVVE